MQDDDAIALAPVGRKGDPSLLPQLESFLVQVVDDAVSHWRLRNSNR